MAQKVSTKIARARTKCHTIESIDDAGELTCTACQVARGQARLAQNRFFHEGFQISHRLRESRPSAKIEVEEVQVLQRR